MSTGSLTAEKADIFEEGNIEAITRMMQNRKKNLLWLAVTSLMVFCLWYYGFLGVIVRNWVSF